MSRQAAFGELVEIRRDLREMRWHLDSATLRDEVNDWIEESHEKSDADTAREFVERKLMEMLASYPMYAKLTLPRGADGFPDACKGCRHYGSACPVVRDDVEVRWRERKLDKADTEGDARRIYERQAIDVDCHRIPELLEDWDTQYAPFVRRGQDLLSQVEDALKADLDDDLDELDDIVLGDAV